MQQGIVVGLHIADAARAPMQSLESVQAISGKGLEGDRYFVRQGSFFKKEKDRPDQEVTLIEQEALEALARDYNVELAGSEARRNIVTCGVSLNHLVGREFTVGNARLRGIRLCEPCSHLERLTGRKLKGLTHRGGLRAQILTSGEVRVGDVVSELTGRPRKHFSQEFLDILDCLGGEVQ
jgi:MOSC domain-containing protein YiiM